MLDVRVGGKKKNSGGRVRSVFKKQYVGEKRNEKLGDQRVAQKTLHKRRQTETADVKLRRSLVPRKGSAKKEQGTSFNHPDYQGSLRGGFRLWANS